MAILTIITATSATIKTAKSIYNAPEELESLLNDLSEAEIIVRDIQLCLDHRTIGPQTESESSFNEKLKLSEKFLLELKVILEDELNGDNSSTSRKRFAWLRAKRKTKALRRSLARVHSELPRRLSQIERHQIKTELSNLSSVQAHLLAGVERLESFASSTTQQLARLDDADYTLYKVTPALLQNQANMDVSFKTLQHKVPRTLYNAELNSQNFTLSSNLSTKNTQRMATHATVIEPISIVEAFTHESLMINAHFRTTRACEKPTCLIGQCAVGYKALPILPKFCTDSSCKKDETSTINISYIFPRWWIRRRMMILSAKYEACQGPVIALEFPRIVSPCSPISSYTSSGNRIELIKGLFNHGLASPKDLRSSDMRTPLQQAINHKRWPVVQFLVQYNPGPESWKESELEMFRQVWVFILSKSIPLETAQWLAEIFPYPGNELFGLSSLHEAVLEIGATTVEEEIRCLSSVSATINDGDLENRTPLFWAASRGDIKATELLLQSGADPNISTKYGYSPLLAAIRFGYSRCVPVLLQHGADSHCRCRNGGGAFYYLASAPTPLFVQAAESLYIRGVDIDSTNKDGSRAIHAALQANNTPCLRWLLEHNADYKFYCCQPLIHYFGFHARLEDIKVFRAAQPIGIDVHETDGDGYTALMYLLSPTRPVLANQDLINEFNLLLKEIEDRTNQDLAIESSSTQEADITSDGAKMAAEIALPKDQSSEGDEFEDEFFQDSLEVQESEFS